MPVRQSHPAPSGRLRLGPPVLLRSSGAPQAPAATRLSTRVPRKWPKSWGVWGGDDANEDLRAEDGPEAKARPGTPLEVNLRDTKGCGKPGSARTTGVGGRRRDLPRAASQIPAGPQGSSAGSRARPTRPGRTPLLTPGRTLKRQEPSASLTREGKAAWERVLPAGALPRPLARSMRRPQPSARRGRASGFQTRRGRGRGRGRRAGGA